MDGESAESTGEDEVVDVGRDGSELEWLSEGSMLIPETSEAYWKEKGSVVHIVAVMMLVAYM